MLVLSRKKSERIVIDPKACPVDQQGLITLTIVEIRGDKVRLGIEATTAVPVHLQEVFDAIHRNEGRAA